MTVKNVAAGKVISVFQYDGIYAVFANYGSHYFAYCNLDHVLVKTGDIIKAGEAIGKISTPGSEGLFELELLMGTLNSNKPISLDPYPWFARIQYF